MRRFVVIAALLVAQSAAAQESPLMGTPIGTPIGTPVPPADTRVVRYTLELASSSKNLSLGAKFKYWKYAETSVATDALMTTLLTGFALDDQDGVRFTASQTVGAKIVLRPFSIEPRHGARPGLGSRHPDFIAGVGVWGLGEFDSLAQGIRLGDNGFYGGVSVGAFGSFVFSDVTVTLAYRPISQTRYYLGGRWDSTEMNVGNPVLDIDFSYTFP